MSQPMPKIVSINAASRDRAPGLRIINDSRRELCDALCRWGVGIRAGIAEELFLLADGTRERLLQTRYLDLRQDIERRWNQFIDAFRHDFIDGRAEAPAGDDSIDIPDFDGLQLVADDTLSEGIVVREFAAQLAETCDDELYALDRRVAALLGREEPAEGENPMSPVHICEALAGAAAALGLDADSRLLLLRRIERHLHLALPALYHDVNGDLIERGILPDLKRSYRRAGQTGAGSAGSAAIDGAAMALASAGDGVSLSSFIPSPSGTVAAPAPGDLLATMQRLVAARGLVIPGAPQAAATMPTGGADAAMAAGPGPLSAPDAAAISQAFLASLNEIQHIEWKPTAGVLENQVRVVRESAAGQQAGPLEAVTIDIVAMLFDFIFNDAELPATVKALVAQLQIPVLKVAMLDHSFFANRQHPTRRFLDSITGVALHWGAGADADDPFLARLENLVTRIQQEFETNIEIFGEAIAELERFVTEHEAEQAATVEIAADAVIRREAEEIAVERARAALAPLLAKPQPQAVREFLAEHWMLVLCQKALVAEAGSASWNDTVEVAEQLIWSVDPKSDPEERARLIGLLPMLLARINAGLALTGVAQEERGRFFDTLVGLHAAALKGGAAAAEAAAPVPAAPQDSPAGDGDLLVTRHVEEGITIEEVMLVGAPAQRRPRDRDALEAVRALTRGDWVDFIDADGNIARERLNWVSPQKGILVFSNHRAAKAISISPEALARQVRDGAAVIVDTASPIDRALDGVARTLNAA